MKREFACIAEAVVFYLNQGFKTVDSAIDSRIMRRGRDEVIINREALLTVIAEELICDGGV